MTSSASSVSSGTASAGQLALFNPEGLTREANAATLRTFFARTYILAKLSDAKPATVQKYRDTLAHWQAAVGDVPLSDELQAEVNAFCGHLKTVPGRCGRETLSDWSIKQHIGRLKRICRLAKRRGLIRKMPDFPRHRIDKEQLLERYWVSREEIELVIADGAEGPCDKKRKPRLAGSWRKTGDWWRAILYVTWWTAARIGEVLALEWRDLDQAEEVLTIRPLFKRAEAARVVVLDARCLELLARIRPPGTERDLARQRIFTGLGPHANLARHFTRLFAWAGVELPPGSAWHSLRRGRCESEFLAGGKEYAQARLGHRDLATTEASYLRDQIERLASIEQQRMFLRKTQQQPQ